MSATGAGERSLLRFLLTAEVFDTGGLPGLRVDPPFAGRPLKRVEEGRDLPVGSLAAALTEDIGAALPRRDRASRS